MILHAAILGMPPRAHATKKPPMGSEAGEESKKGKGGWVRWRRRPRQHWPSRRQSRRRRRMPCRQQMMRRSCWRCCWRCGSRLGRRRRTPRHGHLQPQQPNGELLNNLHGSRTWAGTRQANGTREPARPVRKRRCRCRLPAPPAPPAPPALTVLVSALEVNLAALWAALFALAPLLGAPLRLARVRGRG